MLKYQTMILTVERSTSQISSEFPSYLTVRDKKFMAITYIRQGTKTGVSSIDVPLHSNCPSYIEAQVYNKQIPGIDVADPERLTKQFNLSQISAEEISVEPYVENGNGFYYVGFRIETNLKCGRVKAWSTNEKAEFIQNNLHKVSDFTLTLIL